MSIKSSLAAASLCLLPLCSQAGIMYQWTATNNATPWGITLDMEFDKRTVKSGQFKLDLYYDLWDGHGTVPKQGILGLRYSFPGLGSTMTYSSTNQGFSFGRGYLQLDLQFVDGGYLTGSIYANDSNSHIYMTSVGNSFQVKDANSDQGMPGAGCGWQEIPPMPCAGATGFIRRVNKVPEPGSVAVLILGAIALAGTRRRPVFRAR